MPELPDLEVLKENLAQRVVGRTVQEVTVHHPAFLRTASPPPREMVGRKIQGVERRGKYLILSAQGLHLVIHLMRAAWIWHGPSRYEPTRSTLLRLGLDDGNDLRVLEPGAPKLARGWFLASLRESPLRELGVEPLSPDFTLEQLRAILSGKRRQLKRLLGDQRLIAGIGNAYADEILFEARLSPFRYAHTLRQEEIEALWNAIPRVLRWAIEEIKRRVGDGLYQKEERSFLRIHGRAGAPCPVCGTPIAEVLLGGQRTDYCPRCQHVDTPLLGRS
ncbi:MAG TPA: Fpg/Nei family DNA glycosylase [Candidatus Acetothermia bacterium]|nr:Fpg/Nei family DNA glycosylase [Candidatus Bipolaricaulota bacterium]HDI11273.1 Fpg/Nei family DNA glycosylase [Candidatus Acetothermia bacterium]